MDIFSPIHQYPLRILFDFEKIEKLSLFSTENQLSVRNIKIIIYLYRQSFSSILKI